MLYTTNLHTVICNPSCINGICVANDTCSCMFGYTGDLCDMKGIQVLQFIEIIFTNLCINFIL